MGSEAAGYGCVGRLWGDITHRLSDRLGVAFGGVRRPGGVHPQHGEQAVAMLLGDPERIAADHEIPADRRMAGGVGLAVPDREAPERGAPVRVGRVQPADRLTRSREEEVLVVDPAGASEALPEGELPLEHGRPPVARGRCAGRCPSW